MLLFLIKICYQVKAHIFIDEENIVCISFIVSFGTIGKASDYGFSDDAGELFDSRMGDEHCSSEMH